MTPQPLRETDDELLGRSCVPRPPLYVEQECDLQLGDRLHLGSEALERLRPVVIGVGADPERTLGRRHQLLIHAAGVPRMQTRNLWARPDKIRTLSVSYGAHSGLER